MPDFAYAAAPPRRPVRPAPEPMECRVRGTACAGSVPLVEALLQLGAHPGKGAYWPRCDPCAARVAGHIAGIKAAAARRETEYRAERDGERDGLEVRP